MFPTVREVLALESFRRGAPRVLAGAGSLDRPVRWVHSAEVPDIASLLRGGELVLTTGIGLPAQDDGLRRFVAELAEVGCSGLVVELGRRYVAGVPRSMVAAAERHGLPLVELRRATPFVQITEAVHAGIVDAQLAELRATEEIHQRFTELSVEGAEPAVVVAQVAELAKAPVVLESLGRQVLAFDAAGERADLLLDGWEEHSRRVAVGARTGYDADSGWLVTTVGARGQDWGRLLLRWPAPGEALPAGAPATPPGRLTILVERAASALALGRLIRRDAEGLEQQIHHTVLTALLDRSRPVEELVVRAKALGVPLERRRLIGVVVRHRASSPAGGVPASIGGAPPDADLDRAGAAAAQARLRDLAEAVTAALREVRVPGLVGPLDDQSVGTLLALRPGDDEDAALAGLAAALRQQQPGRGGGAGRQGGTVRGAGAVRGGGGGREGLIVAAGSAVDTPREARRTLVEARQVAYAARHDTRTVPVFRLPHVGLVGLLHLLREQPPLQTFVERELGALLAYDAEHPRDPLLRLLRAYLDSGRNKSAAAAAAHLSRPAFYERLAHLERILGVDLDSVPACLSLHVALLALDAIRDGASFPSP